MFNYPNGVVPISTPIFYNIEYLNDLMKYGICLPEKIKTASLKRQCEFAAGRYCAAQAIKKLGYDSLYQPEIGLQREPIWPKNMIGSISHCYSKAIAVVGRTDHGIRKIGVDIEPLISSDVLPQITQQILLFEDELLFEKNFASQEHYLTVVFSAKESLYKAIFPEIKKVVNFHVASVIDIDPFKAIILIQLNVTFSSDLYKGRVFPIRYKFLPDNIIQTMLVV